MNDAEFLRKEARGWREEARERASHGDHDLQEEATQRADRLTALADRLDAEPVAAEPTLEEVLAELGHYGVPQLWETPDGWRCMVTIDQGIEGEATEATPLQAASECLRRVKR